MYLDVVIFTIIFVLRICTCTDLIYGLLIDVLLNVPSVLNHILATLLRNVISNMNNSSLIKHTVRFVNENILVYTCCK